MGTKRILLFACIVTVGFLSTAPEASAEPPARWACDAEFYDDGTCDCGCGATDSDCTASTFAGCERSGCSAGSVPWEHSPSACMGSACGDGWRDEAGGEVCDDFEALDGGGCAADCSEVNAGWVCGDFATGCETEPDAPEPDAGVVDAGDSDIDEADGGTPDAGEADAALDAVSGDESDTSPTAASADDGAGCSVVPAGGAGLWALAAMGVLGFGRRRRSPAH